MLVADLHHFLDLPDDVPGPARRLAEQLGNTVRAATAGDAGPAWETALPCRRRPARRACPGRVIVARPPHGPIRWQCSACGDEGVISNWDDSPYDLRRRGLTVAPATTEIVIPDQVAAALRDLQLLDPDCQRIVFSIRAHGDHMVLTATAADNNDSTPPSMPSPAPPTPCPGERRTLAGPRAAGFRSAPAPPFRWPRRAPR